MALTNNNDTALSSTSSMFNMSVCKVEIEWTVKDQTETNQ